MFKASGLSIGLTTECTEKNSGTSRWPLWVLSVLPIPQFIAAREDFVPRASCPCSGMAKMAMAQLWSRHRRAVTSVRNSLPLSRVPRYPLPASVEWL